MSVDSIPASLASSSSDETLAPALFVASSPLPTASDPSAFDLLNFELDWSEDQHFSDEEQSLFPEMMMDSAPAAPPAPMTVVSEPSRALAESNDPFLTSTLDQELEYTLTPMHIHLDLDKNVKEEDSMAVNDSDHVILYPTSPSEASASSEEDELEMEIREELERDEDPDWTKENDASSAPSSNISNISSGKPQRARKPYNKNRRVEESAVSSGRVQKKTATTTTTSRKGRKKPKAHAWLLGQKAPVAKAKASGKRLYEQETPFEDPELERCRLNALCAKQNREKKKKEQEAMRQEVEDLRRENERLRREQEAASADRRELERLRALLRGSNLSAVLDQVSCGKRHASQRAKEACKVCSRG